MKAILTFLMITVLFPLPVHMAYSEALPIQETTANDRREIALSVYNNNLGLVKDVREVDLQSGFSELRFKDISNQIRPTSVMITSLNMSGDLNFLEQSYEYDLIDPQKLMDKYLGQKIKLIEKDEITGAETEVIAELISNNKGPIYRIGEEIHIGHPGRVVLPKLPDDLMINPTLVWSINTLEGGKYPLEVSYLTDGLNWEADYAIMLNTDETRGDMSGWVTIKNTTGISYGDASIQLIAGEVARIGTPPVRRLKGADMYAVMDQGISEEGIFEQHIYDIQKKVTLKHNQTKQIQLLNASRVPVKKELRYYGAEQFYRTRYADTESIQKVGVYLEFENKKTFHLGIPLPQGTVRAYKKDSQGRIQFLGEDRISHIPEDEKVRIQMGYAFDIVAERRQVEWRKPASDLIEVVWEIVLRNQKKQAAWVVIIESVPGDWEVMESSHQWKKEEAHTLRFDISVAPKAEEKIRYKVRIVH